MKTRLLVSYLFRLACIVFVIWQMYRIWTGKTSVILGIGLIIGMLLLLRNNLVASRDYSPVDAGYALDLSIRTTSTNGVTPEYVAEILGKESVIHAIKIDLMKTGQIGYKEVWRFGLITPDLDRFDPRPDQLSRWEGAKKVLEDYNYRLNCAGQLPVRRAAVLHSTSYFNVRFNNLAITEVSAKPSERGNPSRSYSLNTNLSKGEFVDIRNIQVNSVPAGNRSRFLPGFLKEEGFPLKESYADGDPLTTERGGTIVIDKGKVVIIHPRYFVQRRLIDDEGNLVDIGLDESFDHQTMFDVKVRPSVSQLLVRCVSSNGYIPILRYGSFPYASDFMLPILDTPMSSNGWADLLIDTRGKAKLFIAKEKTEAEWYEMMKRLRELFYSELARKDYHFLGLTKDRAHLNQYLSKKLEILEDYYVIRDWQLL